MSISVPIHAIEVPCLQDFNYVRILDISFDPPTRTISVGLDLPYERFSNLTVNQIRREVQSQVEAFPEWNGSFGEYTIEYNYPFES